MLRRSIYILLFIASCKTSGRRPNNKNYSRPIKSEDIIVFSLTDKMNSLEQIVSLHLKNIKKCSDRGLLEKKLIEDLKSTGYYFYFLKIPQNSFQLTNKTPVEDVLNSEEKYRVAFLDWAYSQYEDKVVYIKDIGLVPSFYVYEEKDRSSVLEMTYQYLEELNSRLENKDKWDIVKYQPIQFDRQVSFDQLKQQLSSSRSQRFIAIPVETSDHGMMIIVDKKSREIEFFESNALGELYKYELNIKPILDLIQSHFPEFELKSNVVF